MTGLVLPGVARCSQLIVNGGHGTQSAARKYRRQAPATLHTADSDVGAVPSAAIPLFA